MNFPQCQALCCACLVSNAQAGASSAFKTSAAFHNSFDSSPLLSQYQNSESEQNLEIT